MRDNRFIMDESDVYFPKDDIVCKTCKFRLKKYPGYYKFSVCDKYPNEKPDHSDMKPNSIVFKGENCEFYEKES